MHRHFLALALLASLAGCQDGPDYGGLDLVDVRGRIVLDGQPLAGATVRFEGPPGRFSEGTTDALGQYRLRYDSAQYGCTPGRKTVRITAGIASEGGGESEGATAEPAPGPLLSARYNTESTLTADVSPANQTWNFDLVSKP